MLHVTLQRSITPILQHRPGELLVTIMFDHILRIVVSLRSDADSGDRRARSRARRVSLVVDPERRHGPAPHDSTGAQTRNRSFELVSREAFDAARDLCVELRRGRWIAFVEVGDRVDDVGDRLFGVGDLQRPRAASMISRARLASTTRP